MVATVRVVCIGLLTSVLLLIGLGDTEALRIDFLPSETQGLTRERRFFPFMTLTLSDGSSIQTSIEHVVDTYVDEAIDFARQNESLRLRLNVAEERHRVVLLSFDAAEALATAGHAPAELQAATLHLFQRLEEQAELQESVVGGRLLLYATPPVATWRGEPISWQEAEPMGMTPGAASNQPFDPAFIVAESKETCLLKIATGAAEQFIFNNVREYKFIDTRLTQRVIAQTQAGQRATLMIYGDTLPPGPGTDPGPWTNSALGDFTASRLVRTSIPSVLTGRVVREFEEDDVRLAAPLSPFGELDTISAVSSSNTLYLVNAGLQLAGYSSSGDRVLLHDVAANCALCVDSTPLVLAVGKDENLFLLLGARRTPATNVVYAVSRGGVKLWETPLPDRVITTQTESSRSRNLSPARPTPRQNFMVKPDGNLFGIFIGDELRRRGLYEINAETGQLVQVSIPTFIDAFSLGPDFVRFAPDGTMYLVTVDTEVVQIEDGNLTISHIRAMAFDVDGAELWRKGFTVPLFSLGQVAVGADGRLRFSGGGTDLERGVRRPLQRFFVATLTPRHARTATPT